MAFKHDAQLSMFHAGFLISIYIAVLHGSIAKKHIPQLTMINFT